MGRGLRIGHAAVPSWITAQTASTWGNIPASNTLADVNPDLDPAANPEYPTNAPWRGATRASGLGYWPNLCTGWNGMAVDTVRGLGFMVNNGGHDGCWVPVLLRWDLNREAPIWTRINNPPGATGSPATSYNVTTGVGGYFGDTSGAFNVNHWDMPNGANDAGIGIPRAIHTTNYSFYLQGIGPGNADEITIAPSGGSDTSHQCGYIVSESTGLPIRTSASGPNGAGGYSCADVDTTRGHVWKKGTGSFTYFTKWNLTDGASWSNGSAKDWYLTGPSALSYSPDLDLFLVGNGGVEGQSLTGSGFALLDPATGLLHTNDAITDGVGGSPSAGPTWTGGSSGAYSTGLHPGTCRPWWSAIDQCFYAWDNSSSRTQLMRIKHTSGAVKTGGWTIDYLTVGGSNAVTPTPRAVNGTYGRAFLLDDLRIFVVLNAVTEAGVFFKLP